MFAPTLPARADTFSFIAYGDTRSHPDDHAAVIRAIVRLRPEFVLQSGDLVAAGGNPHQWTQFDGIIAPLRSARIAYYPSRGNHDVGPYYIKEVREPYDSGTGYYYGFTRHGARFLMMDSLDPQGYGPGTPQGTWITQQLAAAQRAHALCFVMFHEAPFSVGPHGPTPEAQRYLHPLFVKYKPTAVFCGHDHLYYRTTRDGVTYFVTGGGGAPLYDPVHHGIAIAGDVYCTTHHVIKCDVAGRKVTFTAISLDGSDIPGLHPLAYHVTGPNGRDTIAPVRPQAGGTPFDRVVLGK